MEGLAGMVGWVLVEEAETASEEADEGVESPIVAPEGGVLGFAAEGFVCFLEGDEGGEGEEMGIYNSILCCRA